MDIDRDLIEFFKAIYRDNDSVEACERSVREAFGSIAPKLGIVKAEFFVNIPASKLCQSGVDASSVLIDSGEAVGEAYKIAFVIMEKGKVVMKFYPAVGCVFDEEQKQIISIAANAVYIQYNRLMTGRLVQHVVSTDMETGAATLGALMKQAGMLIAQGRIEDFGVIFFNIHNFKYVNKVLSYEQGDVVLRDYTRYLIDMLSGDELIARLGGDNFVMLVEAAAMKKYIDELSMVSIGFKDEEKHIDKTFIFGATVGFANLKGVHFPREVMARVSIAYSAARRLGAGYVVEYSDDIRRELMRIQSVLSNFITALNGNEFEVYYQPKVRIKDKKIFGAEALVRWNRDGRVIAPADFVPLLERDGSVIKLDYYVLEQVCKWLKNRIDSGLEPLRISVNFSRKHLEEEDLLENIVKTIDKYGLEHKYIEIELTESEDYQNFEPITELVNGLKNNGIVTSMDDFGTGFSSLNMIKNVDLQVIKIDKSFIPLETEYEGKDKDLIMFYYIINMVKKLGKETIAEGVESVEQLSYLEDVGCDAVQGFVFDRPLKVADFEHRLAVGYTD